LINAKKIWPDKPESSVILGRKECQFLGMGGMLQGLENFLTLKNESQFGCHLLTACKKK